MDFYANAVAKLKKRLAKTQCNTLVDGHQATQSGSSQSGARPLQPSKPKTQLNVRVTPEFKQRLVNAATKAHVPMAQILELALTLYEKDCGP